MQSSQNRQIEQLIVNAHLLQFNTSDSLSFETKVEPDPIRIETPTVGLSVKYTF